MSWHAAPNTARCSQIVRLAESEDVASRLRVARELAGYRSADALAAAMRTPRLSGRTLRDMENGIGVQGKHPELRHIAAFCRVTFGFFAADFDPRKVLREAAKPLEDDLDDGQSGPRKPTTADLLDAGSDFGAIVDKRAPATAPGKAGRSDPPDRPRDERAVGRRTQPARAGGRS